MDSLLQLAERCEAAEASEQRALLDEAFDAALGPRRVDKGGWTCWHDQWLRYRKMLNAEAYESAAMMLVPEGWHTGAYYQGPSGQPHRWILRTIRDGETFYRGKEAKAAAPALALCAAALRARHSQGVSDNG